MKILLLGNAYWREDFEEFGHEVIAVGHDASHDIHFRELPVSIHEVMAALPAGWAPDLILLGDDSMYPSFLGLEFMDVPLVWYAIDSHIHLSWHRTYAAAFDIILVAQKDYVASYQCDPVRQVIQWCPLFCDPQHDRYLQSPKRYDLCFVGTLNPRWNPARVRLIEELRTRVPIHVASGDYVQPFNESRVVLNQCAANDVNFRTFQAMSCGSLLLMERVGNGLTDLFQDQKHLVLYETGNVDQIVDLTRYYGAHEGERETIAACGRALVAASHTRRHRAEGLLALLAQHDIDRCIALRKTRLLHIQSELALVYESAARAYGAASDRCVHGSGQWRGMRRVRETYAFVSERIRSSLHTVQGGVA